VVQLRVSNNVLQIPGCNKNHINKRKIHKRQRGNLKTSVHIQTHSLTHGERASGNGLRWGFVASYPSEEHFYFHDATKPHRRNKGEMQLNLYRTLRVNRPTYLSENQGRELSRLALAAISVCCLRCLDRCRHPPTYDKAPTIVVVVVSYSSSSHHGEPTHLSLCNPRESN